MSLLRAALAGAPAEGGPEWGSLEHGPPSEDPRGPREGTARGSTPVDVGTGTDACSEFAALESLEDPGREMNSARMEPNEVKRREVEHWMWLWKSGGPVSLKRQSLENFGGRGLLFDY